MLSEYIDNTLSGHGAWECERHLATCHECTLRLNELRQTVACVSRVEAFAVSPEFMERLQARLDGVTPRPARGSWLAALGTAMRPRMLPAWGMAAAACALAVVMLVHRAPHVQNPDPSRVPQDMQAARTHSMAMAAMNPMEDLATASLAASVQSDTTPDRSQVE